MRFQAISFVIGATASALAGFIGMRVATAANSRTTHAAQNGLIPVLKVAFTGGSIMGMSVVGLAILGFLILFFVGRLMFGSTVEILSNQLLPIITGGIGGLIAGRLFSVVEKFRTQITDTESTY